MNFALWLLRRHALKAALLALPPLLLLAHVTLRWGPVAVARAQTRAELDQCTRDYEQVRAEQAQLQLGLARLLNALKSDDSANAVPWLPQQDSDRTFDAVAAAWTAPHVAIEQLRIEPAELFAAHDPNALLALESVHVSATGDYAGIAACLDRMMDIDLPLRVRELSWSRHGGTLRFEGVFGVAFEPQGALREALAAKAAATRSRKGRR